MMLILPKYERLFALVSDPLWPNLPAVLPGARARFIDAASRYYELSSITARTVGGLAVGEDDLIGRRAELNY
jgi:hypothetical protein